MTDLFPSTPSKPVAAMSTPPPINWATKPRAQLARTNEQVSSVLLANMLSTPRRLIPIFIDPDHIGELRDGILCLALVNPTVPIFDLKDNEIERPSSQQRNADYEEHVIFDGQSLTTSKSDNDSVDLTISTLATLTVSSPPSSPVLSRNLASLSKKRYYVITVGKCAGVFYCEWFVKIFCRLFPYLTSLSRDNISHLVLGVSGAKYKGFSTHKEANEVYHRAKRNGEIRIVRNPGDDDKYGPIFYAIQ